MINCKHSEIQGNTTKYYYCKAKRKAISERDCKYCMLKISDMPKMVEEVFGKGFRK